ncbi:hypothetical protein HWV62_9611 [Athelia sp. TMB]|nr:hypothetical protein HWV62_9611 [Athelia sp. TMB]
MPEIFKDTRGRLVGIDGRQVTTELAILLATAMALGAYTTDIDQEIFAETRDGPISTRTSVTIDFSTNWHVKGSPWAPPTGMPLAEAVGLLIRGIRPLDSVESRSPSPDFDHPSRTPTPGPRSATPGPRSATQSPPCPPSSRSLSPVLCSALESLVDQDDETICDVCLAKLVISSPLDCDCQDAALQQDAALAHSLDTQKTLNVTLSQEAALAQYLETQVVAGGSVE